MQIEPAFNVQPEDISQRTIHQMNLHLPFAHPDPQPPLVELEETTTTMIMTTRAIEMMLMIMKMIMMIRKKK